MELKNKKVIIIGGSEGIGLATAKIAHNEGADVVIASRNKEKLEKAKSEIGSGVEVFQLDGSDEEAVKAFFDKWDHIDHLVLTASGGAGGALKDLNLKDARDLFDSKYWLQVQAIKYASSKMKAGSSITMFSGIVSRKAMVGQLPYTGIAGAIESAGRMLALELAPVRVNVITPGLIHTPAWNNFMPYDQQEKFFEGVKEMLPVKRIGTAEDVAKGVQFFMENDFVTGAVLDIDGGHKVI